MKKKLKLRPNSIYKEEIHQMIDDIIPIVDDFYKKRNITVKSITYNYTTDLVSFEFDEPKGMYPKFYFYIATSDKGVRVPTKRIFVGHFTLMGISKQFEFELRERGIFAGISVGDGLPEVSTAEKLKHIFDTAADRLAVWDAQAALADIFLF